MPLKRRIGEAIFEKYDRLYVLARCINNLNDPNLVKLLKGYYEQCHDYTSILVTHNGTSFPSEKVYYINQFATVVNKKGGVISISGLCAMLHELLAFLYFSDFFKFTPVVEWGNTTIYYDPGMDQITQNVFEYYFDPVSKIDYREIKNCRNVIKAYGGPDYFLMEHPLGRGYAIQQDEIEKFGYLYKKYIHLNERTKEYIKNNINKIINDKKVLAVHVRGTDFNQGRKDHPVVVSPEEYLMETKSLFERGKYNKVFLATDDTNVLKIFEKEFKDKLLYYADAFRAEGNIGVQYTLNDRPLHHYKLGMEVLRDVYTLANCDSLVCGLSNVSFAAQYVNIALGKKFENVVIIDNGINEKDLSGAKEFDRQRSKLNRERGL